MIPGILRAAYGSVHSALENLPPASKLDVIALMQEGCRINPSDVAMLVRVSELSASTMQGVVDEFRSTATVASKYASKYFFVKRMEWCMWCLQSDILAADPRVAFNVLSLMCSLKLILAWYSVSFPAEGEDGCQPPAIPYTLFFVMQRFYTFAPITRLAAYWITEFCVTAVHIPAIDKLYRTLESWFTVEHIEIDEKCGPGHQACTVISTGRHWHAAPEILLMEVGLFVRINN